MLNVDYVNELFSNRKLRKLWLRLRVLIGVCALICLVYVAKPEWFWLALGVSTFGELIQVWCFASLDKKKTLSTKGLYGVVRNPMYLGRFFIVLGYLCLIGVWYVLPLAALIYIPYMTNRVKREEEALEEIFGDPYDTYRQEVGCFVPKSLKLDLNELLFFRWKLLIQNNGILNLALFAASYVVIYLTLFVWQLG